MTEPPENRPLPPGAGLLIAAAISALLWVGIIAIAAGLWLVLT